MIPYGRQQVDDDDVAAVSDMLRGDWLTQGPCVAAFEAAICDVTGARFAVAFSSGTAALHGACAAARIGPGDRVAAPALTFAASVACAMHEGASPVLVDIDRATFNLDPSAVPRDVDALVAVHFAGLPVRLDELTFRPRVIIEDAAHAIGATTPDGPVGGCQRSDLCCFSFHPVKAVTSAEGGAVTTNDEHLADRLRRFRSHSARGTPEEGGWVTDIERAGFNYRLSDVHAALGTSQLEKLERFIARRNALAARYRELLAGIAVGLPPAASTDQRHAYHLFPILVADRRRVYDALRANGIGVQVHYVPVHHHSAFQHLAKPEDLPSTEAIYAQLLSLPMFPALTDTDQDRVVEVLGAVVGKRAA